MPLIQSVWERDMMGGPTLVEAQRKLKECRSALSSWSNQKFVNVARKLRILTRRLDLL
jgi:hypothetical protein